MRPAPRRTLIVVQILIIAVLIIVGLAGCATAPPPVVQIRYQVERVSLPPGLLTCSPAPPVPAAPVLQSDVATYVVRLDEAYQDCNDTVASIAQIENAPAPAQTK